MKKLLAVAVSAALLTPLAASADAIMYGRVNVGVVNTDSDNADSSWDTEQNASRWGVRGTEDLGNGLTGLFQFEFGVDASDSGELSGRLAYAGIAGDFGTFAVGRQTTPYYSTVDKTDLFATSMPGANDHYLGPVRIGNAVAYVTPNFSGVTGVVALVVSDDVADQDAVDLTNISVNYDNGPLSVGFSYLGFNGTYSHSTAASALSPLTITEDSTLLGVAGKYNFGSFALTGQYERLSSEAGGTLDNIDVSAWGLGGEAYFGNNTIKLVYGVIDSDDADYNESNWGIGFDHALSKRTHLWLDYNDSNIDENKRVGLGLRHDF